MAPVQQGRPEGRPTTSTSARGHYLARLLPIIAWVRGYRPGDLRFDLVAGGTLAAFAVPESLAYASLAGLRPEVGLYAGIAAMLAYFVFGTSRLLGVGVTSALAVLTVGTIGGLAGGDPVKAAVMAAFATLVAGAAALVGWVFRLGFLANLVSRSVLTGFTTGAGIFIASTQLAKLFGFAGGHGEFFARMATFFRGLPQTHWPTLAVGALALALLLLGRRFARRWPIPLGVVVLALALAPLLHLSEHGVNVVGEIPRGLPAPSLPLEALSAWRSLVPLGLSLFVLSYVEGVSAARSLAAKHGGHVDPNQEMLANGVANTASALLRGMPVGGSLTRSSVNVEAGARTQLSGGVGGVVLIVVVAFLTGVFANLPDAVLAAIILVAVVDLVDFRALRRIFHLSKREFVVAALTAASVLLFGMLWGVVIGVALSLLDLLERTAFPHIAELGRIPDTDQFADRDAHPEYRSVDGVLVVRIDASLVFANAHVLEQAVLRRLREHSEPVRLLILDIESSPIMDLSGADMLRELAGVLEAEHVAFRVVGARGAERHLLRIVDPHRFGDLGPETDVAAVVRVWREQTVGENAGEPAR